MNAAEIQHAEMRSTVERDCRESLPPRVRERLDSWKEIACYLRRSIRCVVFFEGVKISEVASQTGEPLGNLLHAYYRGVV